MSGGSSGIGAATARALAAAGARVAILARDTAALAAVAREIGAGLPIPADVRDENAVRTAVARAAEEFGGLDVVVAAAGLGRFGETASFSTADWDLVLDVDLRGTFLVVRETLPALRRSRGHVFTLASIAALRPFPASAAYCAAKAGVRALAQVVAEEYRNDGVRVTDLVVGSVDSPFWDRAGGTTLPRERMLRPEDVARVIVEAAARPPSASVDEIVLMPPAGIL